MVGEPPTRRHAPPMRRCMVVAAIERKGAWIACCCRGSFRRVDQGTVHLMVGLPVAVEAIIGKVHRKHFLTAAGCSDCGGRF